MVYSMTENEIDLSIVIPVFNESGNIYPLFHKLKEMLDTLNRSYEIIIVDDGSTDSTHEMLNILQTSDPSLTVIRLRRNFGQTPAFTAGFDRARGAIIVTMDGDLQNDPADIPKLLMEIDKGYDIVSGWRKYRTDNLFSRRIPSRVANFLISRITGVALHDYGCSLKAYRSEIVKNIKLYGDMHRFIPAIASWMGVKVCEVEVRYAPRNSGKSKYGLVRTLRVLLDLMTVKFLLGYSTSPLRLFGFLGILSLLSGFIIAAYLSSLKLFFGYSLAGRPLLLMAVLLIIFGVQLGTMGLLGELVIRSYYESQNKPTYMIREILEKKSKY
jgi:glycosyltransferase involved in cell wall biosynthesis